MITGLDRYKEKWNITTDNAIKPGLQAITAALAELGDPQKRGTFIHIAGTNGKGSTAAFLSSILMEHGLSVGNFFSPNIEDLHDQIQLNRVPIAPEELDFVMQKLSGIHTKLTDFELLTAAAFVAFDRLQPDVTIIEAGMGGRFDSTNVISPAAAIISSIALEHTNFLGHTLEEIAWHKAGIIKETVPVIIGELPVEAVRIIEKEAAAKNAPLVRPEAPIKTALRLKGKHQLGNARLAHAASEIVLGDKFSEAKAVAGLAKAVIPYRFEEVAPGIIFDGAHNEASIEALVETVKKEYPDRKIRVVFGILKDKEYIRILRKLETISNDFTFVDFENERALPANVLFQKSSAEFKTIKNGCDKIPVSNKNEVTLVTGSLYLLALLKKQF